MPNIYLAEKRVKDKLIDEILKLSDKFHSKKGELKSKTFSEVKYLYYECRESNKERPNYSFSWN